MDSGAVTQTNQPPSKSGQFATATVGGVWWAATAQGDVNTLKSENRSIKEDIRVLQSKGDRLAILEAKLESISKTLEKMELALSRQGGRPRS